MAVSAFGFPQVLGFVVDLAFVGQLSRAGDSGLAGPVEAEAAWAARAARAAWAAGQQGQVRTALFLCRRAPWKLPASCGGWQLAPGLLRVTPGVFSAAWPPPPPSVCAGLPGGCRAGWGRFPRGGRGGGGVSALSSQRMFSLLRLRICYVLTSKKEGHEQLL